MCVCGVSPSRCIFSSTGGKKAAKFQHWKKEFRMLGTLRSDICVNPGEMWWNVSTAHALDACASVCVCGECVRVCMRRPSVFKACGGEQRWTRRRDSLLNHWRSTWLPLCLCVCVCLPGPPGLLLLLDLLLDDQREWLLMIHHHLRHWRHTLNDRRLNIHWLVGGRVGGTWRCITAAAAAAWRRFIARWGVGAGWAGAGGTLWHWDKHGRLQLLMLLGGGGGCCCCSCCGGCQLLLLVLLLLCQQLLLLLLGQALWQDKCNAAVGQLGGYHLHAIGQKVTLCILLDLAKESCRWQAAPTAATCCCCCCRLLFWGRGRRGQHNLCVQRLRLCHCLLSLLMMQLSFHTIDAVAQMLQQTTTLCRLQARKAAHLIGTVSKASLEFVDDLGICSLLHGSLLTLQLLQMLHCLLQYVGLFQLGMTCWLQVEKGKEEEID